MNPVDRTPFGNSSEPPRLGADSRLLIPAVLLLLLSACQEDLQTHRKPFQSDSLWVAFIEESGSSVTAGELVPIGRYYDGIWGRTWPDVLNYGSLASVDSLGVLSVDSTHLPPIERIGMEGFYLKAPLRWHFYSDTVQGDTLIITHLALGQAYCGLQWVLSADDSLQVARVENNGAAGIAFSRPVESISPDEISNLDSIQTALGLVRKNRGGDGYRNFVWLGFFRLEDGSKIGIVNDIYYEGEVFRIISFRGNEGATVIDVYGGGC